MDLPGSNNTAEELKKKIEVCIDGGFMTLGLALGSATGLFDVMCGLDTWATSEEIAEASKCKER